MPGPVLDAEVPKIKKTVAQLLSANNLGRVKIYKLQQTQLFDKC